MNKRNWAASLLVLAMAISSFQSCSKNDEPTSGSQDTGPTEWVRSSVFPEDPRNGAATFVINNQGYVIGGFNRPDNNAIYNDVWAFDGSQWQPKAALQVEGEEVSARHSGVGFSIDGKGYVGTGFDGSVALNDFYSYDAATNAWTKIADFPGEARFGAVAFSLGGYGYVGLGETVSGKTFSDFYKFDPSNGGSWELVTTPFTYKKSYAFSFVIGDKAYVGGGTANGQLPEDFYSFDGTNWTALRNLNRSDSEHTYDVRRFSTAAFAVGGHGFIASGRGQGGVVSTVWKYNPSNDTWTGQHQAFQGSAREKAVAFAIDGKGYVTTGSGSNNASFFDDNWAFTPVR